MGACGKSRETHYRAEPAGARGVLPSSSSGGPHAPLVQPRRPCARSIGTGNGRCPPGTASLYRLYNNFMGGAPNHRYTTSVPVVDQMIAAGWTFEGEAATRVFACVPG